MATVSRKASKSKPFSCAFVSMTIAVNDTRYAADPIEAGEFGTKAFRLAKHSGDHAVYDVVRQADGIVACDCPDYESRHRGNGYGMCKHGRALVELGLLPAPIAPEYAAPVPVAVVPAIEDTPAPCCSATEPAPCQGCVELPAVEPPAVELPAAPIELPGELVDPGDAESDPELWGPEHDEHLWNLGPDPDHTTAEAEEPTAEDLADDARSHLDQSERLTLAELVDRQAAFYRSWNNEAGEMFARAMTDLAFKIAMTDSTTPAEFEARADVLDAEARAQWEAIGYDRAMESIAGNGVGSAFGHMA